VRERRGHVDLAEEALGAERGSHIRPDDLDRHLAAVLQVASEVHGRHAALAEFPLDLITAGQRRAQRLRRRLHQQCSWGGARLPRYTFRREIRATTTREGSGQRMNSVVSPFGSMTFWYGVPS